MKMKQIIKQTLSKKQLNQMKSLTINNLAFKMLHTFSKHIGEENSISRPALFRKIFGRVEEPSLADELRWDYVKRAMHRMRQRTKCFVGSRYVRGLWRYFVIKDTTDAQYYVDTLEKNIKRMRAMQIKAVKAANEKWCDMDWIAEAEENKQLGYFRKMIK